MAYTYTDINLSLLRNPATFDIAKRFDVDAVKTSVKNILSTNKGEKLFNPEFGANLESLLFELMTPATKILARRKIIEEIQRWEPRVVVTNIDIQTNNDFMTTLSITVDFYIIALDNTEASVTVNLKKAR